MKSDFNFNGAAIHIQKSDRNGSPRGNMIGQVGGENLGMDQVFVFS